jgi:hypothetical protein
MVSGFIPLPFIPLPMQRCRWCIDPLTPSLSPSDGERVAVGRVRGFVAEQAAVLVLVY